MPCGLQIIKFLAQQMYIIKGQLLILASPTNDEVIAECKTKTNEIKEKIREGLNTIISKPGCHYVTSQLIVHRVHKVEQLKKVVEFDEIDTINTLASLEELLEEWYPPRNNMLVR
jgi:molybdopterin converting factor small subunit